ncbi:unnamed protein product [Lathyrus oleraceus]|uniref:Uncharacterized protein n=1 Tax=Pisum sativum TaxID=3888 RepID=A0A9D5AUM7_PEA|nr:uncharacterized protein LOC127132657 [Pisum sativum]KAI5424987.1 hypothetical protein KIW84_030967 [Pisum sativum]
MENMRNQITFEAVFNRATFDEDRVELHFKKQDAAADILDLYSKFVIARVGTRTRSCDLRLHLMKEISGMLTSLKSEATHPAVSPETTSESSSELFSEESSSSGTEAVDMVDSFLA